MIMTDISANSVFLPSQNAAYRQIGEDVVVVDTLNSRMLTLNKTGSQIWMMLSGRSVEEIAVVLTQNFEVDADRVIQDIHQFLADLIERGLVTEQEPA